jgi:CO dehydrogenase maturation factor
MFDRHSPLVPREYAMKLGIVGKGGVGKTTTSALVARAFVDRGRSVIAIDTDSNPNLGMSLGMSFQQTEDVPILPRSVIVGTGGDLTVDELLERYGRQTPANATLLSAIRVTEAGAGCTCSGHATVRSLLGEALDERADVTIVDMEAGLEHLSRSGGTLAHADVLLVVMEPSRKSVITAARTVALADELGIARVYGLGNKARDDDDVAFFRMATAEEGVALAGILPYTGQVRDADRSGTAVVDIVDDAVRQAVDQVVDFLEGSVMTPV